MLEKSDVQRNARRAGLVTRYHTWMRLRDQSVAEHTWQVLRLYFMIFGEPRIEVVSYIIKHDLGEVQTGDPPYPVKAHNPVLKTEMDRLEDKALASMDIQLPELTAEEKVLFKFCDLLDCSEYGLDEVMLGNKFMGPVVDQVAGLRAYLEKMRAHHRNAAVQYCGRAGVPLDRDYLRDVSPLLCNTYDNLYRESISGRA